MTELNIEVITGPNSNVIEALRGEVSGPKEVISNKPGSPGKRTVRVAEKGPAMIGLKNLEDNREWAGIFNHYVKTAGASLELGILLQLQGLDVDPRLLLNTVMISHSGRRQYDEATWYPQDVKNASEKKQEGDVAIGLDLLKDKNLPDELMEMVSVHGLGTIYPFEKMDSWNKKIPMYLDFRISQNAMPMEQRFVDLQRGVSSGRYTQEYLDSLHKWAAQTEKELFEALAIPSYDIIIQNPQNLKARIDTAIKLGKFSEDEAKQLRRTKLYKPKSGREDDVAGIVGLSADEFLDRLKLHPEDINDRLLQPERWERYIRRLYINDAEEGIFARLSELHKDILEGKVGGKDELEKEFPENTWWGKYARELYAKRQGKPLHPRLRKQLGINRAIEFYHQLEQTRQERN